VWRLPAGEALLQWIPGGTVLHVRSGRLLVTEAPRFWCGPAWCPSWPVERGQVWVAPRAGWVHLSADAGPCELNARLPAGQHCPPPRPY